MGNDLKHTGNYLVGIKTVQETLNVLRMINFHHLAVPPLINSQLLRYNLSLHTYLVLFFYFIIYFILALPSFIFSFQQLLPTVVIGGVKVTLVAHPWHYSLFKVMLQYKKYHRKQCGFFKGSNGAS